MRSGTASLPVDSQLGAARKSRSQVHQVESLTVLSYPTRRSHRKNSFSMERIVATTVMPRIKIALISLSLPQSGTSAYPTSTSEDGWLAGTPCPPPFTSHHLNGETLMCSL